MIFKKTAVQFPFINEPQPIYRVFFMTIFFSPSSPNCNSGDLFSADSTSPTEKTIVDRDREKVKVMLKNSDTNPNQKNKEGLTLMALAVITEQPELLPEFLNHPKIDLNLVSSGYGTALHLACSYGDIFATRTLLRHSDINPNDTSYSTPLVLACKFGYVELVKELINHHKTDVNLPDNEGITALCTAILYNREDILRILLDHPKINTNIESIISGEIHTPQSIAVLLGHKHLIEILVSDSRVSLISVDSRGDSALMIALTMPVKGLNSVEDKALPLKQSSTCETKSIWTHVSFLPVSNDKSHSPPKEFSSNLKQVNSKLLRSGKFGEIELTEIKGRNTRENQVNYQRVVYRCHEFVTVSLLQNNTPIGVTIYRPLFPMLKQATTLKAKMQSSTYFWHIANKSISIESQNMHEFIKVLADKKLCVFRALNDDNDPKLLLRGTPLKGKGNSRNVKNQVDKGNTALVSSSTRLMTKFLTNKKVKNGGYVCILRQLGAKLLLGEGVNLPGFLDHDSVIRIVSDDARLVEKARGASEALFTTPIDTNLVVYFDDGYPSASGRRKKSSVVIGAPSRKVQKLLKEYNVDFAKIDDEFKKILLSNVGLRKMRDALEEHLIKQTATLKTP